MPALSLEEDDLPVWEAIPDPAGDKMDEIWQREWEDNLIKAALRRVSAKVSAELTHG